MGYEALRSATILKNFENKFGGLKTDAVSLQPVLTTFFLPTSY
jgi:hypothetical protein